MNKDGQVFIQYPDCEGEGISEIINDGKTCPHSCPLKSVDGTCGEGLPGICEATTPPAPPSLENTPAAVLYAKPITGKNSQEYDARLKWDGGVIGNKAEVTLGTTNTEEAARGLLQIFRRSVKGAD